MTQNPLVAQFLGAAKASPGSTTVCATKCASMDAGVTGDALYAPHLDSIPHKLLSNATLAKSTTRMDSHSWFLLVITSPRLSVDLPVHLCEWGDGSSRHLSYYPSPLVWCTD